MLDGPRHVVPGREHMGQLRAALRAWENADEVFEPAREAQAKLAELGG